MQRRLLDASRDTQSTTFRTRSACLDPYQFSPNRYAPRYPCMSSFPEKQSRIREARSVALSMNCHLSFRPLRLLACHGHCLFNQTLLPACTAQNSCRRPVQPQCLAGLAGIASPMCYLDYRCPRRPRDYDIPFRPSPTLRHH
jgi:hypothetical protein